jgi:hypothetical protein
MPLTARKVEELAAWCLYSEVLTDIRSKARSEFFGYDEPGEVKYAEDTDEVNSRNRRLIGWFSFYFRMPDGTHPAEMAAADLFSGPELASALKSIRGCRFIMAVTTTFIEDKIAYLKLQDEEFRVDSPLLSRSLYTDDVICAHLMPVGRERWLVCPGWVVLPLHLGRNIRSHLKRFQPNPIETERLLQQRTTPPNDNAPKIEYPADRNMEDAVSRMTKAAQAEGRDKLVKSPEEWQSLVLTCIKSKDINLFSKNIIKLAGKIASVDEANKWLGLAINIWNNTPQPDRGGRTANEMMAEFPRPQNLDNAV